MRYPPTSARLAAVAALALSLTWGVALAGHAASRNQYFDDVLLFVMEGTTALNQFGLPAAAPPGDL